MTIVKRVSLHSMWADYLKTNALPHQGFDVVRDVETAIQHYLGSVPGNWTLLVVVADGMWREFYWSDGR